MKSYFFTLLIAVLMISGCGASQETGDAMAEDHEDEAMMEDNEEITEDIDTSDLDELDADFMKIEEFL